ncbi:hypothetical protein CBR_g17844 [Chara braunii]|uniref:Protein kinase domain-containing protein n=1 Tax=Chara braunii TaxID=69332 RepID=A0A388KW10_CHABU|nr:hypothetical protein CBR_g17844 [Chara braunii]|eukprot:GBG74133.1 hypothetical protein CBR_g17844 [Chara braunii]
MEKSGTAVTVVVHERGHGFDGGDGKADHSTIIDKYVIRGVIGRGGGGRTYRAEAGNGDEVILKVFSLKGYSPREERRMLKAVSRVMRSFNHVGIPRLIDCLVVSPDTVGGEAATTGPRESTDSLTEEGNDRSLCVVQKAPCGRSLEEVVLSGFPLTEEEVVEIAVEVLHILVYLEERLPAVVHTLRDLQNLENRIGVHRDINPGDIIVDVERARYNRSWKGHVKLVGFGAPDDPAAMASCQYKAPEQLGERPSTQSDLYSLGLTILYVLCGREPGELPRKLMYVQFRHQVQCSEYLVDVLDQMLEPGLAFRFQFASEVVALLCSPRSPTSATSRSGTDLPFLRTATRADRPDDRRHPAGPPDFLSASERPACSMFHCARRPVLHPKPAGTMVSVCSDSSSRSSSSSTAPGLDLKVEIPPPGWHRSLLVWTFFLPFIAGLLCPWQLIMSPFPHETLVVSIVYYLPACAVSLWLLRAALKSTTERVSLKIDGEGEYTIKWSRGGVLTKCLSLGKERVKGRVENVLEVRVQMVLRHPAGPSVGDCLLIEPRQTHGFGTWLDNAEKLWLADEINAFIYRYKHLKLEGDRVGVEGGGVGGESGEGGDHINDLVGIVVAALCPVFGSGTGRRGREG